MTKAPAAVELDRARRSYGPVVAVDSVSLTVAKGEFVTLLGPSGSGKTSTLRLIGGFEPLDGGEIRIDGARVDHLPAYRRDTATVFQSGALFPHKTVAENIAFGLRMRRVSPGEIVERIKKYLDIVRLGDLADRYPSQLSGGQKQRVALARSLAVRPAIVLFDEPLSALDLSLRLKLRSEIKALHDDLGFSAIYVTHDQGEAMALSDRVAVMCQGRIEQIDTPSRIFHEPASEFVYTFIGESCCLPVRFGALPSDQTGQPINLVLQEHPAPGNCRLYIRPARLQFNDQLPNRLTARVQFIEFLGDTHRYHLRAGAIELFADHSGQGPAPGDDIVVGWQSQDMRVFR